jgi:gp16 family phage-associated protein
MSIKTPEQVKAEFRANGKTITGWARDHGFPPREVILVLNGYYECHRGRAYEIAVAIGIKAAPAGANQQAA